MNKSENKHIIYLLKAFYKSFFFLEFLFHLFLVVGNFYKDKGKMVL